MYNPAISGPARALRITARHVVLLVVTALLASVLAVPAVFDGGLTGAPASAAPKRVLIYSAGAYHASRDVARDEFVTLAGALGYQADVYDWFAGQAQPAGAHPFDSLANLQLYSAVVFSENDGVRTNAAQRANFEAYITGGGGFLGLHTAGWNTEADWTFYQALLGARSGHHPDVPPGPIAGHAGVAAADVRVTATGHPLTAGLPAIKRWSDEWYDWRVNPAPTVRTLLEVDEASYEVSGWTGRNGLIHPVTWCQQIQGGRSWYSALGHHPDAFIGADQFLTDQLRLGMRYTMGDLAADCSVPTKAATGAWNGDMEWSGVTPWPVIPINMALTADGKVQTFGSVKPAACANADTIDGYDTDGMTGAGCGITQGGQFQIDVWDPAVPRTLANRDNNVISNTTYTDLFCSVQVLDPTRDVLYTAGGDDSLGGDSPNGGAIGVTSYSTAAGLRNEAPMNLPRWYPTASVMPNGDIVVQGGADYGVPGQPIITPERYSPNAGNGWQLLTGAANNTAYGNVAGTLGADENRWWYPRAFVAPNGNLFNISGSQMYELDPNGTGTLTLRGTVPAASANQGALGIPLGATSTAVMYRPGRILQVGGGGVANGGGPAGARGGFTVDITGGTAAPVVTATQPMQYGRHWSTATILPDGRVLVSGGGSQNNAGLTVPGGLARSPEIWDPNTGTWSSDLATYSHGRQYHSSAMLLPDGRIMMGGGGAPGPANYPDVEFYSPGYLFNGNASATRPTISTAPAKVTYGSPFQLGTTGTVSRVTMVRAGSVTHSFDNGQRFFEPTFTTVGSTLTVQAPASGAIAPPGTWMVFALDAAGKPSVGKLVEIDPATAQESTRAALVEQFEYPRIRPSATAVNVPAGDARMAPWNVTSAVGLLPATRVAAAPYDSIGEVGYQLNLGAAGALSRGVGQLETGRQYRLSFRYARDAAVTVPAGATVAGTVTIANLSATVTAAAGLSSSGAFGTYTGSFTASGTSHSLALAAAGTSAGMVIDNLVISAVGPGDPPLPPITTPTTGMVQYAFNETSGTVAANTGTDTTVPAASLTGTSSWDPAGRIGGSVRLPGGASTTTNYVKLPNNLLATATDFTAAMWVKAQVASPAWTPVLNIGQTTSDFFLIQSNMMGGSDGLGATFRSGNGTELRVLAGDTNDLRVGQWVHVAVTKSGSTARIYVDGVERGVNTGVTFSFPQINGGVTTDNYVGHSSWADPNLNASVDELRLYPNALTATQVAGLAGQPPATAAIQYAFNETSGTVAANTGTDTTVPAASLTGTSSWDPAGRIGGSVRLPGGASTTTNYVKLPNNLLATATDFTAAMWVKAQVASPAWTPLLNIGQTTSDFFLIQSNSMGGSDGLSATFRSGNGTELRVLAGDVNDLRVGEWVHVAVTKSGSTARIYVDGVERGLNTGVTFSFPQIAGGLTTDNYVGHSSWADPNLNASVDDLRLYPTALTAAQVAVLAAS